MPQKAHSPKIQIGWTTVSYRSVLLLILAVVVLFTFVTYLAFPEPTRRVGNKLFDLTVGKLANVQPHVTSGNQTANFTLIDGTVKVKKVNRNDWINADYQTPLEKGDVIQTSSEGLAKVVFPDGTSYNIKQDSLIVIEENSAADSGNGATTDVKVNLTSGTVDLSTGTYNQGSKSQVVVAGATASFSRDTAAIVRNDPKGDEHKIMVTRGEGDVNRGNENEKITAYEQVSFKADSPHLIKEKQIAPPTLISPANMLPIFVLDQKDPVQFTWSPISQAVSYHLRVSRNPYFSSTVLDKKFGASDVQISSLGEGAFYWEVQSEDINGQSSIESEKNRFTVIRKGPESTPIALELSPLVQHGHVIEIRGKTETSARVMVNGQEVPAVATDGTFQYFTPQLPNGENLITITAQNTHGAVKTLQKKVVIQ